MTIVAGIADPSLLIFFAFLHSWYSQEEKQKELPCAVALLRSHSRGLEGTGAVPSTDLSFFLLGGFKSFTLMPILGIGG